MNITVTKIKRELKKNHGWDNLDNEEQKWFVDGLIKDTLAIVDEQLRIHEYDTVLSEKLLDGAGKFRPKSLHRIENNNGWIDGIPKEKGWYFIEYINKFIEPKEFLDNAEDFIWWNLNVIKHQKIFFPKQSLF